MALLRTDLGQALLLSALLHVLVFGLVTFSWSSSPELERPPKLPSFVQAVVMEKPKQAKPKPVPKPKPKPKPEPEPKPKPRPEPDKTPAPTTRPEKPAVQKPAIADKPAFAEPDLSELLAREELAMEQAPPEQAVSEAPAESSSNDDGEEQAQVASYMEAIRKVISDRWVIPATAREKDGLVVRVRIHLLPGGEVLDTAIIKSSGDQSLDNSVLAAIRGAGRLPVPSGQLFNDQFRVFSVDFKPPRTQTR